MSSLVRKIKGKVKSGCIYIRRFSHLLSQKKRKFNIGSAGINPDDSWYATDINSLNITINEDWLKLLFFVKLDNIMAEHVWEHLTDQHTALANVNCFKYLKRGGVLRLAVPDGYHPDPSYIEWVRPGGNGPGADDHKVLYNYKLMRQRLEAVGFKVNLLEYWDEEGKFHYTDWSDEGGRISRSRRYDRRNQEGKLNYTSLIVDAIKP
jgi:predicted SAM-dependent methyltransferase